MVLYAFLAVMSAVHGVRTWEGRRGRKGGMHAEPLCGGRRACVGRAVGVREQVVWPWEVEQKDSWCGRDRRHAVAGRVERGGREGEDVKG